MRNVTVVFAALLLAAGAFAQMGPGPGNGGMGTGMQGPGMQGPGVRIGMGGGMFAPNANLEALKTYLGLSDAQVQALLDLRKGNATKLQALMVDAAGKGAALKKLLDSGADARTVGEAVLALNAVRKQIEALGDEQHAAALTVLTASQLDKLKALEEAQKLQPAIREAMMLGLIDPAEMMGGMIGGMMGGGIQGMMGMLRGR